jgi:hypothetical protein
LGKTFHQPAGPRISRSVATNVLWHGSFSFLVFVIPKIGSWKRKVVKKL